MGEGCSRCRQQHTQKKCKNMEKRTKGGGRGAYCKLEALDEGIVGKRELIESSIVTFNRLEKKKHLISTEWQEFNELFI